MDKKPIFYDINQSTSDIIYIAKLFSILLVVLVHSYNCDYNFENQISKIVVANEYIISRIIASSAVPLFFFLSSILLYRKDFSFVENIKKKSRRLLIPYFILTTVAILFNLLLQDISITAKLFDKTLLIKQWDFFDFLNAYIGYRTSLPLVRPFWFLRNLFILNIFATLILYLLKLKPNLIMIICFLMYIFLDIENGSMIAKTMTSLFYWTLGCYFVVKNININKIISYKNLQLVFLYLLLIFIDYFTVQYPFHNFLRNIITIFGVYVIFTQLSVISSEKLKKLFLTLSKYTFPIFLFHELTLSYIKKLCISFLPHLSIIIIFEYYILAIVIMLYCIFVCKVLYKISPKFYNFITGEKI